MIAVDVTCIGKHKYRYLLARYGILVSEGSVTQSACKPFCISPVYGSAVPFTACNVGKAGIVGIIVGVFILNTCKDGDEHCARQGSVALKHVFGRACHISVHIAEFYSLGVPLSIVYVVKARCRNGNGEE